MHFKDLIPFLPGYEYIGKNERGAHLYRRVTLQKITEGLLPRIPSSQSKDGSSSRRAKVDRQPTPPAPRVPLRSERTLRTCYPLTPRQMDEAHYVMNRNAMLRRAGFDGTFDPAGNPRPPIRRS